MKFSDNTISKSKERKQSKLMTEGEKNLETIKANMSKEEFKDYKKKVFYQNNYFVIIYRLWEENHSLTT